MGKISIKIKNLIVYAFSLLIIFIISKKRRLVRPNTILLIRLDAIGDYILFRNFLKIIKTSERYKDQKITLLGNSLWKEVALTLDKDIIDDFIWLDRKKFYENILYKYKIIDKIYKKGFETVIEATHSREILYGDMIVKSAKAKTSIGSKGSGEKHSAWKRKLFTNNLYTTLISIPKDDLFEFEVNKELYSKLLGQEISISKPDLDTSCIPPRGKIKNKYIILFPGASHINKMWSGRNFKELAEFLIKNYSCDIVLSGSSKESYLYDEIIVSSSQNRFIDYFGCSLPELAKLISGAELLISNDTSAVHFAASVNTPFICISNGSYFGRFHPYPEGMLKHSYYIYPNEVLNLLNQHGEDKLKEQLRYESGFSINNINPEKVIEVANRILSDENLKEKSK